MADDVMSELDGWLGAWEGPEDYRLTVQRARDEIVALRATKVLPGWPDALRQTRVEALEEAEIACLTEARDYVISLGQDNYRDGCRNCAAAIRLLKDKGQ